MWEARPATGSARSVSSEGHANTVRTVKLARGRWKWKISQVKVPGRLT